MALLLGSCGRVSAGGKDAEIAISRKLERAIEIGEKYLSDRELIEDVARTEGRDAALKLFDELHHGENYESFRICLKESDSIWREIPDTVEQKAILSRMMPYLRRIIAIEEEIDR